MLGVAPCGSEVVRESVPARRGATLQPLLVVQDCVHDRWAGEAVSTRQGAGLQPEHRVLRTKRPNLGEEAALAVRSVGARVTPVGRREQVREGAALVLACCAGG